MRITKEAFSGAVERFALKHFEKQAERLLSWLHLGRALQCAGIRTYSVAYAATMLLSIIESLPLAGLGVFLTVYASVWFIPFALAPLFIFLCFYGYPFVKIEERKERLTPEVPFMITYLGVMAPGGVSPYASFQRLTKAELLPATREESKRLVHDVEVMGEEPLTVFKKAAETNPSPSFTAFLRGYVDTVITGGDVIHYLRVKMEEALRDRAAQLKNIAENLTTMLESYMVISFMLGLMLYMMWVVGATVGGYAMSAQLFYLYVFVVTPLLAVLFLWLTNAVQPKHPFMVWGAYKVAGVSLAVAIVTFLFLPFGNLPARFGTAILVATLPPAIKNFQDSKENRGIEKGITAFLRDYTETRKTGLSPERTINVLSRYNYGAFSKHLKRINWLIETGVPTREAVTIFMKRTKSWVGKVYMYLLLETLDVGGASVATSEALASFASATEVVEREKRMGMKLTIIIPYIMVTLSLVTTIMLSRTLTEMLPFQPVVSTSVINLTLILSMLFTSLCGGLVAGKIAEETLAAGFKHAAILTLLCLVIFTVMGGGLI
jgi:flagellar protein FlaJ